MAETESVRGAAIDILHEKLERAKENLHDVDENIRKFTGREFGERSSASGRITDQRKVSVGSGLGGPGPRNRGARPGPMGTSRLALSAFERLGAPLAKRPNRGSAFSRLGNRVDIPGPGSGVGRRRRNNDSDYEEDLPHKPAIQSSVVAPTSITRTRKDSIEDQGQDSKSTARNRRMFGLLLGTLQKFKDDSVQKTDKEKQRQEIEQKLDDRAKKEKQEIACERRELFMERRNKQKELERLEELMEIAKEQVMWDKHSETLGGFIQTKAKPPLFYRPRKMMQDDDKKLASTKKKLAEMASKRREAIEEEIRTFEGFGKQRGEGKSEKENERKREKSEPEKDGKTKRRRDSEREKEGDKRKEREKRRDRDEHRGKERDRSRDDERKRRKEKKSDLEKEKQSSKKVDEIKKEESSMDDSKNADVGKKKLDNDDGRVEDEVSEEKPNTVEEHGDKITEEKEDVSSMDTENAAEINADNGIVKEIPDDKEGENKLDESTMETVVVDEQATAAESPKENV